MRLCVALDESIACVITLELSDYSGFLLKIWGPRRGNRGIVIMTLEEAKELSKKLDLEIRRVEARETNA